MKIHAPKHLKAAGRKFFRALASEYDIRDSAGLALLTTAAECLDRLRQAQAEIAREGLVVSDRFDQPRQNPACALEKDARNGFIAAIKALGLELEDRPGPGRPCGGFGI